MFGQMFAHLELFRMSAGLILHVVRTVIRWGNYVLPQIYRSRKSEKFEQKPDLEQQESQE